MLPILAKTLAEYRWFIHDKSELTAPSSAPHSSRPYARQALFQLAEVRQGLLAVQAAQEECTATGTVRVRA